jgi:hypothetical protein
MVVHKALYKEEIEQDEEGVSDHKPVSPFFESGVPQLAFKNISVEDELDGCGDIEKPLV